MNNINEVALKSFYETHKDEYYRRRNSGDKKQWNEQYKWDISEAAVAGDGRNDSILVGAAGVGIAMGNSAQETLDVATHIAPNQWDDGAAIALESLIDKA